MNPVLVGYRVVAIVNEAVKIPALPIPSTTSIDTENVINSRLELILSTKLKKMFTNNRS